MPLIGPANINRDSHLTSTTINMNISPRPRIPLTGLWRARVDFVVGRQPTHGLTVSYNAPATLARVRFDLRRLHARIDRYLLGRRFNARPASERTWFAACTENLTSNAHVHLVLRAPEGQEDDLEALFRIYPDPWKQLAPHASHKLRRLDDAEVCVRYALKELAARGEMIMSDEFLPAAINAG